VKVLIAIFVAVGFLVGLFNAIRMVFLLVAMGRWTDGSYHQPALTVLQVIGAAVCVPLALLAVAARLGKQELFFVALVVAGAISSMALSGSTWRRPTSPRTDSARLDTRSPNKVISGSTTHRQSRSRFAWA
jgi:Na+/melibiose symporter-like transporter